MKYILFLFFSTITTLSVAKASDRLCCNQTLALNSRIVSANNKYFLQYQSDGNLVLYRSNEIDLWSTKTNGITSNRCIMQSDGNLVLYYNDNPVWDSKTGGNPNSYLLVQDDGNLVIYKPGNIAIWDTKTGMSGAFRDCQIGYGQNLRVGKGVKSANKVYDLEMQTDGNLVLYKRCYNSVTPIWDTKTQGTGVNRCVVNTTGHILLYKDDQIIKKIPDNDEVHLNPNLYVQDDGNLVFYSSNEENRQAFWATGTTNQSPCPSPPEDEGFFSKLIKFLVNGGDKKNPSQGTSTTSSCGTCTVKFQNKTSKTIYLYYYLSNPNEVKVINNCNSLTYFGYINPRASRELNLNFNGKILCYQAYDRPNNCLGNYNISYGTAICSSICSYNIDIGQ